MINKRITVIGHFAGSRNLYDGQTIKTRMIFNLLKENKDYFLNLIDTYKWRQKPFSLFMKAINAVRKNDVVIFLPARKGVRVFLPLLTTFKSKKTKLVLCTIGAWLPSVLKSNKRLKKFAKKIDDFWVETWSNIEELNRLELTKCHVINNFKTLSTVKEVVAYKNDEYIFCIYSRINDMKGVLDAIDVVNCLRNENFRISLDIYGPIEENFKTDFFNSIENNAFITYKGIIDSLGSVSILSQYFALLFPTKYIAEGIPGTIIDAFFSGLPILTSEYPNAREIMNEDVAVFFKFRDKDDLKEKMEWCINNPDIINSKRKNCIKESFKYSKEYVSLQIFDLLEKL